MFVAFWGKRDQAMLKSPEFRSVAETFRRLRGYVDPASPGRNWNDATTLVIQGKAGMQFMGDWAKGEFTAAGQTPQGIRLHRVRATMAPPTSWAATSSPSRSPRMPARSRRKNSSPASCSTRPRKSPSPRRRARSPPAPTSMSVRSTRAPARRRRGSPTKCAQVPANELLAPPDLTGAVEDLISADWNDKSMSTDAFIAKVSSTLAQPALTARRRAHPARRRLRDGKAMARTAAALAPASPRSRPRARVASLRW